MWKQKVIGSGNVRRQLTIVLAKGDERKQCPILHDYSLHAMDDAWSLHSMIDQRCAQAKKDAGSPRQTSYKQEVG